MRSMVMGAVNYYLLTKVFSISLAILKEWRMIGLLAKRVYVGVCADSHLVGRLQRRWNDSVNDCLKKKSLNVWQAKSMVYDSN